MEANEANCRAAGLAAGMAGAGAAALAEGQEPEISLEGVVDLHFHTGPDSRPRSVDDIEASRLAAAAGMRAILLKNHFTMTADRAAIAMAQVDGLEIFGGLVLNRAVGGINPEAVRQMAAFSGGRGKVVWLPTFDSEYAATSSGGDGPYVSILEDGEPLPAVLEVFELLAEHDLTLAMGHSAPGEVLRLIPEAKRLGVPRILVTHVFSQGATREQMRQMAEEDAIMEIDWLAVHTAAAGPSRTTSRRSGTWAPRPSSCRPTSGRRAIRCTPTACAPTFAPCWTPASPSGDRHHDPPQPGAAARARSLVAGPACGGATGSQRQGRRGSGFQGMRA